MAEPNLKIILTAVDNASKGLKDVTTNVKSTESSFAGLGNTLKGLGITFGVMGAAMGAWNLAKGAAEAQTIGIAYQGMAARVGMAADDTVAALQRASAGTVAQRDLMLAANRAMALGVATTTDQMVTLMDVARKKGQQMGLDTTQAFNDLVTGLGRASPMILDNLGITIKVGTANEAYAKSIGKAASALTDVEKKQALVNAVLAQGEKDIAETGRAADTAADSFARMAAKLTDLKVVLGEGLLPLLEPLVDGLSETLDYMGELAKQKTPFEMLTGAGGTIPQMEYWGDHVTAAVNEATESFDGFAFAVNQAAQQADTSIRQLATSRAWDELATAFDQALAQADVSSSWLPAMRTWEDAWREIIGEAELMPIQLELVDAALDEAVAMMKAFAKETRMARGAADELGESLQTALMTLGQFQSQLTSPGVIAEGAGPSGMARILNLMAQGASAADAAAQVNAMIRHVARAGLNPPKEYATGGVVGGPIGAPQLAVVHGGETVTPAGGSMMVNVYLDGRFISQHLGQRAVVAEQVRGS